MTGRRLFLCVIFFILLLSTTSASQEILLVQNIIHHRYFFARLNGYSDYLLSDVEVIERGKTIGVILLTQEGFEKHLVFDIATMLPIYSNGRIQSKPERERLIGTSIHMSEVIKLAEVAKIRAAELLRGWILHEGKSGNIIPNSYAPNL